MNSLQVVVRASGGGKTKNCKVCSPPLPGRAIKPGFAIPAIIRLAEAQLGLYKTFKPMGTILTSSPHFMVSCLFVKHLLTCGIITVDGPEKLC